MIRVLFFGFILLLPACGGVKDAFSLKKKSSADEFLVEKKSPLVIPPEFGELPTPSTSTNQIKNINENENEIEKLLSNKKDKDNDLSNKNNSQSSSLEESILKKIK